MNTLARPLALVLLAAFVVVALSGAHLLLTERVAVAQPAFQAPPVLSARELLPPDMLAGPLFRPGPHRRASGPLHPAL